MKILKIQVKKQKMQLLLLNQLKRKLKRPLQPPRLQKLKTKQQKLQKLRLQKLKKKLPKHQKLQKQKLPQPLKHQLKKQPLKKLQLLKKKFKPKLTLKLATVIQTTLIQTLIKIHLTPTVIDYFNIYYNI